MNQLQAVFIAMPNDAIASTPPRKNSVYSTGLPLTSKGCPKARVKRKPEEKQIHQRHQQVEKQPDQVGRPDAVLAKENGNERMSHGGYSVLLKMPTNTSSRLAPATSKCTISQRRATSPSSSRISRLLGPHAKLERQAALVQRG